MQEHASRLVGLDGLEVKRVIEVADRLDLEVELVRAADVCAHAGAPRSRSRSGR
jgi:hypothetical protein